MYAITITVIICHIHARFLLEFNPYPGNWGVNYPPVHFFLCISKNLKDTVMRFGDIVHDSQGYLTLYKVLSHLYRKCQHGGLETGSTF